MSTSILNPNDTIVLSDSIIVKVTQTTETCQTCVNKVATNWADVKIAEQMSCAVITIVAICVAGYILVKLIEAISNYCSEERRKKRDEEESNRKQKAGLQDKLLSFIEKHTSQEEYNKEKDKVTKVQKGIDSNESQYYINVLRKLIDGKEISELSTEIKTSTDESKNPQQN